MRTQSKDIRQYLFQNANQVLDNLNTHELNQNLEDKFKQWRLNTLGETINSMNPSEDVNFDKSHS